MSRVFIGFRQLDVLDSLVIAGDMTLAEVMKHTGMSKSSAGSCIQRLRRMSLIRAQPTEKGRRATLWTATVSGHEAHATELEHGVEPGVPRGATT